MITPNKVVSLESSVIGHIGHILKLGPSPIRIDDLFSEVAEYFESIDQFLLALDVLYVLNCIDVDFKTKRVIYAS